MKERKNDTLDDFFSSGKTITSKIDTKKKVPKKQYSEFEVQKRLKLLDKMRGSANGLLTDFSIQSVKASRNI